MNLSSLSRQQLVELQAALSSILTAADALAAGGLEPEISLTDTGTILRAPSVIAEYVDPGDVAIEPVAPAAVAPAAPPPALPPGLQAGPEACRSPAAPPKPRKGRVTGPFTNAERAKVRAMLAAGDPVDVIAVALRRRLQSVALLIHNGAGMGSPAPARQNTPDPNPGGPDAAETVTGNAGPPGPMPPDADGGMVRPGREPDVEPARVLPPVSAAAPVPARQNGSPAPDVPLDCGPLEGEARRVFRYLSDLPGRKGFDPELDLGLCDMLVTGTKLQQVAVDLGLDFRALQARWTDLSATIRNDRGQPRIDGQQALLAALRHRAMLDRGAPAKTAVSAGGAA